MTEPAPPTIDTFDLATIERYLCTEALRVAGGSINVAAKMLGITRHALRRRITKYRIAKSDVTFEPPMSPCLSRPGSPVKRIDRPRFQPSLTCVSGSRSPTTSTSR